MKHPIAKMFDELSSIMRSGKEMAEVDWTELEEAIAAARESLLLPNVSNAESTDANEVQETKHSTTKAETAVAERGTTGVRSSPGSGSVRGLQSAERGPLHAGAKPGDATGSRNHRRRRLGD